MYSTKCNFLLLCLLITCWSCQEEEEPYCSESFQAKKADQYDFCVDHSFSFDTIIVKSFIIRTDSLQETVSTMMLGPKLSSTFLFSQDSFRLVIFAQFSEKFDSLRVLKSIHGSFREEIDFVGFDNWCIPRKRGKLFYELNQDSDSFVDLMKFKMNCSSEAIVLEFKDDEYDYTMIGERYTSN